MFLRLVLLLVVLLVAACGGAEPESPSASSSTGGERPPPPPPPVPQEPLDLIPSDAALVVNARVEVMKDKEAFKTLRRAAVRYACISDADFDWLTAQTKRGIVAGKGDRNSPDLLIVLEGSWTDADAGRALAALVRGRGKGGDTSSRKVGRFSVTQQAGYAAAVLEDRLLVAGNEGLVTATLESIDKPPSERYAQSETYRELADHTNCFDRSVCGLITRDGPMAKELASELAGAGLKKVGRDLADSHTGLTLAVGNGMVLTTHAFTASDDAANQLVKETKDWLWQASLVTRLTGFPNVLGDAEVGTSGRFAEIKVKVGDDDLEKVEKRLYQLLGDDAKCPGQ